MRFQWRGYLTRDKSGDVYLWYFPPQKDEEKGEWVENVYKGACWRYVPDNELDPALDPKWEDEKPIFVHIRYYHKDLKPFKKFLRKIKEHREA